MHVPLASELGFAEARATTAHSDAATADAIHARANDNDGLPVHVGMWGLPGARSRLWDEFEATDLGPLWTQDLDGVRKRYLGPVMGQ
jgi:hypothetical protein